MLASSDPLARNKFSGQRPSDSSQSSASLQYAHFRQAPSPASTSPLVGSPLLMHAKNAYGFVKSDPGQNGQNDSEKVRIWPIKPVHERPKDQHMTDRTKSVV